tara:strand:- start:81 stop:638 length:558 start_codon:yes stop_codon:yes gene_type:complete
MVCLSKVDDTILKKIQAYSEYQQVATGRNCYKMAYEISKIETWLAYYIPAFLSVCIVVLEQNYFFILIIMQSAFFWFDRRNHRALMKYIATQTEKMPEPPKFMRESILAFAGFLTVFIVFIIAIMMLVGHWLLVGLFLSVLLGLYAYGAVNYFLSCTPLPPEVLEFRRNAKRSKRRASVLRPQPT